MSEDKIEDKTISEELEQVDIDGTNSDDYFEQVLADKELKPPEDNEAGDEKETKSADTSDKKVVEDPKDKPETVESLKAEISRLEKEAKGRLSDVVQSRQDKASMKAELADLRNAVTDLLDKRDKALEDKDDKKVPLEDAIKPIEFADDDSAFVDLSEVKDAIKSETEQTKKELDEIKQERALEKAKQRYTENVNAVIDENQDAFAPAYDNLKEIYKDLNDAVIELQHRTGIMGENGTLQQDEAIEVFDGSPEEKAFLEKHPNIDSTRIARAFNSKSDFRKVLGHIVGARNLGKKDDSKENTDTLDEKLRAAKDKPSGLGNTENQAAGATDLISRIASMNYEDLENLSDNEAAKVEAMLEREALKGE